MEKATILCYDGSFSGFLTAVFISFEEKIAISDIQKGSPQNGLFSDTKLISTQIDKAKRVWKGIEQKNYHAIKNLYFAFLSERKGIEYLLFQYIQDLFTPSLTSDSGEQERRAYRVYTLAEQLRKEKLKLESELQLRLSPDGVYFACVSPSFNVLPLISKCFRHRHPDRAWLIYDQRRKYGLYYHHDTIELIALDLKELRQLPSAVPSHAMTSDEFNRIFELTPLKSRILRKLPAPVPEEAHWQGPQRKAG